MANTLVNSTLVTYETLRRFANSLKGVGQFNRQYSDEYAKTGAKIGDTAKIRLPQQYEVSSGEELVEQNLLDRTVTLILNRRRHIGMGWSTQEQTIDLDDLRSRYTNPAGDTLASVYDQLAMADVYKSVYNAIGTPGTAPSAAITYSNARTKIADQAGPTSGIVAVLTPYSQAVIADSVKGYNGPDDRVREAWVEGMFAMGQLGIDRWFMDQNVPRFTTGAATTATPLINGAGQTGSSIITDGWGSAQLPLRKGDTLAFVGIKWVNPLSKENVGADVQVVLTADVTPDSSGNATLSISPSLVTSGPLQNVTSSTVDNGVITYLAMAAGGSQTATVTSQNLVFHRDAFYSAMVDLLKPTAGADSSVVSSRDLNISLRLVQQYDIKSDRNRSRLDFLAGFVAGKPEFATRVYGGQ